MYKYNLLHIWRGFGQIILSCKVQKLCLILNIESTIKILKM